MEQQLLLEVDFPQLQKPWHPKKTAEGVEALGCRLKWRSVGGDPNLGQEGEKQEENICRVSRMSKEQAGCGKERNTLHPNHPKTLVDIEFLSFIPRGPLDPFHLLTLPEFPLTFHSSPSLTLYMPLPPLN